MTTKSLRRHLLATALLATVFVILAGVSRVANLSEIYGIKP